MRKTLLYTLVFIACVWKSSDCFAQNSGGVLNQEAIYDRPFIDIDKTRTALGGYVEGNTNYFSEDGISEGFSMELRRFNLFTYAQIGDRIRFLSELEFEHGVEEISLETAMLDFEMNSGLNFRAGILLPSIGLINVNHDSPKWDIIDRPISSTMLIPTTLSEVGFGLHGQFYPSEQTVVSYDANVVNGLQSNMILNTEGRTSLEAAKSPRMFGEDNNGVPMFNGRIAFVYRKLGEFGFSYYGGVYNTYKLEGVKVDHARKLDMVAIDYSIAIQKLSVQGEAVLINVDVPESINEIYGAVQYGGFIDFSYPIREKKMLGFEDAVLNIVGRLEYADLNVGMFTSNIQTPKGDENLGVVFALAFRPIPGTVIRANYRYHWITDLLGNPAAKLAGVQFGLASYF